ncbi:MAG: response regulator [Phycisphaerae bacterium]
MASPAFQRIKERGTLPSPSGVALELLRLVEDESATIEKITSTVASDPAITLRLLKLVNSPLAGVSRTIASVSTAVKLLGRITVKNLALGFSLLSNNREGASKSFDYDRFWSESLARAVAARGLAQDFKSCPADEAFTVALLSEIGRLALATAFPEAYDDVLRRSRAVEDMSLAEAEREAFGIAHHDLAAEMMGEWRLPEVFLSAVRLQDPAGRTPPADDARVVGVATLLRLAGEMAAVLVKPTVYREGLAGLAEAAARSGIARQVLVERFEAVKREWRELGTVFSVRTQDVPSLRDVHIRASQDHARILVVDDDPAICRLLEHDLRPAGFDVITAGNGVEALRALHTSECRIVITDYRMPGMDGMQLCRAIRDSDAVGFVYIVVLTAHADPDGIIEAFEAGADDYLSKPYEREELLARLKAATRILKLEAHLGTQQTALHKTNAALAVANDTLQRMATTDELTGLPNRREAMRRLEEHWAVLQRRKGALACMMIDIDHFKQFNDRYGHDVGDLVLRETAHLLARCTRAGETAFRLGGEEFVVLCPEATARMADAGAERLRAAVEGNRIQRGDAVLAVTISVGLAEFSRGMARPDDLLKQADEALYQAKRNGRNRVCVFGHEPRANAPCGPAQDREETRPAGETNWPGLGEACGHVLVVDDDPTARRLLRTLLENEGFSVDEACDGEDALARLPGAHPDVILMDALMPRMDGLACTRKLKNDPVYGGVPVIMVSGQTDETSVQAAFEAGAREYITKPVRSKEFVLRVRAMVQLYRGKTALARSNEVRGEQARAMGILFALARSLADTQDADAIADHVVTATAELTGCRRVSIMLPDDSGRQLQIVKAIGISETVARRIRVPVGQAIAGRVFASGKPIVINTPSNGAPQDVPYESEFFASVPLASRALVVPNKVLGVLNVTDRQITGPFTPQELEYLDLICNMTASAVEQVQARRGREHAQTAIVTGLAKLAEHRDSDTGYHLERVTRYALRLAEELRRGSKYAGVIDSGFLEDLRQGMPLHDIGKVAVRDAILLKPGPLTDAEFAAMQRHVEVGARSIRSVIERAPEAGFLKMAEDICFGHHERFDGTGYPRGLSGEEIPLAARIAAVADVYDALRTKRPYKAAFSHDKAVRIIRESAGSHFDPDVVEAFLARAQDFADLAAELGDAGMDPQETTDPRSAVACAAGPSTPL